MAIPNVKDRREIFNKARAAILAPALAPHGFHFAWLRQAVASGGAFAQGELDLWEPQAGVTLSIFTGLVNYHLGVFTLTPRRRCEPCWPVWGQSLSGASRRRACCVRGTTPRFTRALFRFRSGPGEQFRQCVQAHKKYASLSGFRRWKLEGANLERRHPVAFQHLTFGEYLAP